MQATRYIKASQRFDETLFDPSQLISDFLHI